MNVRRLSGQYCSIAIQPSADLVPNVGVRPIATDQVACKDLAVFTGVRILGDRPDSRLVLFEFAHRRPAQDAQFGE
jgi:hypothetical protein